MQEALVAGVSDSAALVARGEGGALQTRRHAPEDADDWAFLNTKLANDAVTLQVRPPWAPAAPPWTAGAPPWTICLSPASFPLTGVG